MGKKKKSKKKEQEVQNKKKKMCKKVVNDHCPVYTCATGDDKKKKPLLLLLPRHICQRTRIYHAMTDLFTQSTITFPTAIIYTVRLTRVVPRTTTTGRPSRDVYRAATVSKCRRKHPRRAFDGFRDKIFRF